MSCKEMKRRVDQSGIELLPFDNEPAKELSVESYHRNGALSIGNIHTGVRAGGAKGKKRPNKPLIQAIKDAEEPMIDEWIEYFEFHPEDEWGRKLIDKCGYEEKMNAVHVAVIRNRVQILTKLAKAGADLMKCTEDDAKNPPLVLAARRLPKFLFEKEITNELKPKGDDTEQSTCNVPVSRPRRKSTGFFKVDNVLRIGAFHERAVTAKHKNGRMQKIMARKNNTKKLETTTFHVLLQHEVNINGKNCAGVTALHAACERGIIIMVKKLLLSEGIEINQKDDQGNTPLHAACVSGEKDIVFSLIEAGANVMEGNEDKMTPFHIAVAERKLEIVKMILDMRAGDKENLIKLKEKDGNSPFLLAVKNGDKEMVKFLLDNGANLVDENGNGANALHLAASLNKVNIMGLLYYADNGDALLNEEDLERCTPLHYAAKYNQVEALEFLLDKGAETEVDDDNGRTPLLTAAASGKIEALFKLLDRGVDIEAFDTSNKNIIYIIVEQGNSDMLTAVINTNTLANTVRDLCRVEGENGKTPLHLSCEKGDLEIVKIFLDNNLTVDERNYGKQTPLHLASIGGHHEVASELLKKGAKLWIKDDKGKTPLHHATSHGQLETVKLLINNQADIDSIDGEIGTPLTCAAENGHEEIVDYLLKSGADVDGKFLEDKDIKITPLIAACQNNHVWIVKRLLRNNADVTHEYYYSGLNCLAEAILKGHSDVALAIVQSDQWEDAMRLYNDDEELTPMKLLIRSMPEVATVVLNRCITDNKSKDIMENDRDYCISYNYEYLEDYKDEDGGTVYDSLLSYENDKTDNINDDHKPNTDKSDKSKQKREKEKKKPFRWGPSGFKKEDHPLQVMVESQRIELLNHRIVKRLLDHKWRAFGFNFYVINMTTYLIFLGFLTAFALVSPTPNSQDSSVLEQCSLFNNETCLEVVFPNQSFSVNKVHEINETDYVICQVNFAKTATDQGNDLNTTEPIDHCFGIMTFLDGSHEDKECTDMKGFKRSFLRGAAIIVIVFAVIRLFIEAIQFLCKHFHYFLDWENWMELCLFIATIIFVSSGLQSKCLCPESWQWQLGAMALFIAWLDMVLFLKKFPLTGIYVVMFVDIFYTFMRMILLSILFVVSFGLAFYMLFFRPGTRSAFSSPGRSLIKTLVMTTGEFDFDGMFFNTNENDSTLFYPEIAYILWIVFIILMPVILTNLLVGLAVDDIKGVQETAALKRLAQQVDLALDVEDLMVASIRKRYRKKTEDVHPNQNDSWLQKLHNFLFPADKEEGKKKSKIGDLRPPLSPIEHVQAETSQHSEELSRLKVLIKSLTKRQKALEQNQDIMVQNQDLMVQKQDLILQHLKPKSPAADDVPSVIIYDVSKAAVATDSDEKLTTEAGGYKLKSSRSKLSVISSDDTDKEDDDDIDPGKEKDDDYDN